MKKITTIENLAQVMQKGFANSDKKLENLAQLTQGEFLNVRKEFSIVHKRLDRLEQEFAEFKKNVSELFTKLDEFISLYRETKAENILLARQLRRLEERVAQLEAHNR